MAKSITSVLGYTTLTKAVQATSTGIPNPFPEGFMKVTEKVMADRGRYILRTGERRTSRLVKYGGPSRKADLKDVKERDVKLIHTFESQPLDPFIFEFLRAEESYQQDVGLQQLKYQIAQFSAKFMNLRIAALASVLRLGAIYFDGDGNLLPSSSGAVDTVNMQLPANNQNQLNGIISASWAVNSTNIPLHLANLDRQSAKDTGRTLKYAFYGRNIPGYMSQNDYVLDYLARSNLRDEYLTKLRGGAIPDGLFGFKWVYVDHAFFEDSTGTNQDLWAADAVVFTPDPSDDWWGMMEGSYPVPKSIDVVGTGMAAFNNVALIHGMFGYAMVIHDPVSINNYFGDTFLPVGKVANAWYSADVTP